MAANEQGERLPPASRSLLTPSVDRCRNLEGALGAATSGNSGKALAVDGRRCRGAVKGNKNREHYDCDDCGWP